MAKDLGLRALAVTDHDTVEGVSEAIAQADALGIELVPGVEISANFGDVPVHVLGLFIEYREPWLLEFFAEAGKRRVDRVHQMVEKLAKLGRQLRDEFGFEVETRMGLNSGEVVIGKIGNDFHTELKPFGLVVPLAQRVEAAAEPGQVYLTESTARLAGGFFEDQFVDR